MTSVPPPRRCRWAGLHYFASRRGSAANASRADVVTWPEGNAYLARWLARGVGQRLHTGVLGYQVRRLNGAVAVDALDCITGTALRIEARAAILAVPRHVLERIDPPSVSASPAAVHYPWVVANITCAAHPGGPGVPLAWDNVKYRSELLGYVVADHQRLGAPRDAVVLTYYWPLSAHDPGEGRRFAQSQSHADWCAIFLRELLMLHPELRGRVENVDVWVWGHGMICPTPGYCGSGVRAARHPVAPPVFLAHTDLSGISVFEEAFSLGQAAAAARLSWRG